MIYDVKKNRVIYFDTRHWEVMGKLLPARLVEYLGTRYGWHRFGICREAGLSYFAGTFGLKY